MLFIELRFFLFAAVVYGIYWLARGNGFRKLWLLIASYAFYGAWDKRFLGLIALSTAVDYLIARELDVAAAPRRRKLLLGLSITINLGVLGLFKYFNFFAVSAAELLQWFGFHADVATLSIVLPVGISFYTFQTLSYCIDVYRRRLKSEQNVVDFALYVAFFPQLVAGPIMRASEFLPQLKAPRSFAEIRWQPALLMFLIGFVKKSCISDNLSPYVDAYFASPGDFDAVSSWLAAWLYCVQIYCDFSGYSDMGIACAALLGYRLCRNFRHPYLASSVGDFWRRWHVSLSMWLRDYVYIPLGGSRDGEWRTRRNLLVTMLLGGLWHGAAWTFVAWGAMHGLALVVQRAWSQRADRWQLPAGPRSAAGWAMTFYWVGGAWMLFRAQDLNTAWLALQSYAGLVSHGSMSLPAVLWLHLACLAALHCLLHRVNVFELSARIPQPAFAAFYGASASACLALSPVSHRPFIYFQF
ncbi:MAG TPA: MBOAT family protein [Pirellulales bacterium]|nr:MBOAT family protein [Pirellulales bacterium]